VGFEGEESVGGEDDDMPAGFQNSNRLFDCFSVIVNVLQDLIEQDDIKHSVLERELLRWGDESALGHAFCFGDTLRIDIDSVEAVGVAFEGPEVSTDAAADIKNLPPFEGNVFPDHPEPPFLPRPPEVAWGSKLRDSFVLSHSV